MGKIYGENSVPSIKVTFYILKDQIELKPNFGLLLQIRNKIVKMLERIFVLLLHSRNIVAQSIYTHYSKISGGPDIF